MQFNYKIIFKVIGILLLINGGFMLTCLPFSLYYAERSYEALILSSLITMGSGAIFLFYSRNRQQKEVKKKDGYLIVIIGWLFMSFFGSLPYIISGAIPDITNAFFETISGFSTTGATVLTNIESVEKGILFWRSLTQWIGGMGIIVLAVAILPLLGIGGMQLFVAEAPGITPDKLEPRIKETAKRLWIIYCGLTLLEMLLLWIGGMTFFDAINHSLTTMSTGGFSTKDTSIAYYSSPFIQYVIIIFMFLAGTNFTVIYFGLHGKRKKVIRNEEFKVYLIFCISVSFIVGLVIFNIDYNNSLERSIRDALFQVVSVITTTGYVTYDYTAWTSFLMMIFFFLMFSGGSAGSTAGGMKLVRHILFVKNSLLELKRILHPSAIIPVRFNEKSVNRDIIFNILAFFMIYLLMVCFGAIAISSFGIDFQTSIGAVVTTLGNIGPGIGDVGPMHTYAHLPSGVKWILAFIMLLGRLELFTVLILFTPFFWRKV